MDDEEGWSRRRGERPIFSQRGPRIAFLLAILDLALTVLFAMLPDARPDEGGQLAAVFVTQYVLAWFNVIFSFSFDKALQQRTITALLACAAAVELVYCIGFMLQELAFRIPNETCVLSDGKSGVDGAYSCRRQQKQLAFLFCVYAAMSKF